MGQFIFADCKKYIYIQYATLYCKADQPLCFLLHGQNNFSTFFIQNFKPLAIFCACTALFVLDLFRNHIVGFLMTLMAQLIY